MNISISRFLLASLTIVAGVSAAQCQVTPQPVARQSSTLTAQEKTMMQNTAIADARVQQVLGAGQSRVAVSEAQVDKYEALAFLRGDTDKPPTHRVQVVMFNPATNKAVYAFMSLEQNNILRVKEIPPADTPLFPEDGEEALAMAKASPEVQLAVGSSLSQFVYVPRGNSAQVPFAAQVLRTRSSDPNDPCSVDRCLDLIFKTQSGYLPLRLDMNLTKHTLVVRNSQLGKGKHP